LSGSDFPSGLKALIEPWYNRLTADAVAYSAKNQTGDDKMRACKLLRWGVVLAVLAFAPLSAQDDQPGGKDHPLLSRMPGYYIDNYTPKDFDRCEFEGKDGKPVAVEGRTTVIVYRPKDGVVVPSPLQIGRNYQNAITKVGGAVLFEQLEWGGGVTTMKLTRGTDEIWVKVGIGDSGNNYTVTIVEKAGMKQEVVADAEAWKSDINATGHAAVYGIYFDSDRTEIKAGSEPSLQAIAKLLKQNPRLNLLVVGHTDGAGEIGHNMTLSEARAQAVVSALTGRFGVAPARLTAFGCGPLAPIASNDSEAGKAMNRRVELVKRQG
jgi:outer membrane protein OmpA-like peptidoglycan-associated protein